MAKRRKFTPEFKAELVLEVLSGATSQAEVCRRHNLNENQLSQWKRQLLENAPMLLSLLISSPAMPRSVSLTLSSSLGEWPSR